MKYGYSLMGVSPRYYAEVAAAAEAAGFESIWLPEHLVYPEELPATYPYSESGLPVTPASTPLFDPWVVLAYVACATCLRVGGHRHPEGDQYRRQRGQVECQNLRHQSCADIGAE